jgi:hypothetical protein
MPFVSRASSYTKLQEAYGDALAKFICLSLPAQGHSSFSRRLPLHFYKPLFQEWDAMDNYRKHFSQLDETEDDAQELDENDPDDIFNGAQKRAEMQIRYYADTMKKRDLKKKR